MIRPVRFQAGAASGRRGSALSLALITVAVVASAGAAFLQLVTSSGRRESSSVDTIKAFYVAEAGLADGFHAVRIGRSGQIGSAEAPALFGDGLVWVNAEAMNDGLLRLTSTGMAGTGRSTLSYVLEPKEVLLGIFSAEDMVIDNVLLVDGYDSSKGSYADQVPKDTLLEGVVPPTIANMLSDLAPDGLPVGCHLGYHNWCTGPNDHTAQFGDLADPGIQGIFDARSAGMDFLLETWRADLNDLYDAAALDALATGAGDLPMRPVVGVTTGEGGLLGSNQNVTFSLPAGNFAEVYGDVHAGHGGELLPNSAVVVSGDSSSRPSSVNLPPVSVPTVSMLAAVTQNALLPMVIDGAEVGYDAITVAPNAELIIQGPATVVIGQLTLESGATLTLDTRSGDVALFVTAGLDLQAGSATVTMGTEPEETTLQVAAIESAGGGAPIKLNSDSQFIGTIYAPETEVAIGSNFEVFGGVIARKLSFGPGARLHVDRAGSGSDSLPKIIAWQIVEIPAQIRGKGTNPYQILGVDKEALLGMEDNHELTSVTLHLTYVDTTGLTQSYSGIEAAFDWGQVDSVTSLERSIVREDPLDAVSAASPAPLPNTLPTGIRPSIQNRVDNAIAAGGGVSDGGINLTGVANGQTPLSLEEWDILRPLVPFLDPAVLQMLIDADIAAGGTGGGY